MDWAEDLKQTIKKTVKKGRRATEASLASSDGPSTPEYDSNFQENALSDEFSSGLDFKSFPGKQKHRSGWTDEPVRSGSSGKERFSTVLATSPPSDDIPELPDLDDVIDEAAINDAKEVEALAANRVETYKELNFELLKYSEFASSENIDLSKLMHCLQDENVLSDHDVPLTKEQLFSEVASFIHSRKPKSAEENVKAAE
ncbi:intraflagellar transport protein 43 homolog isoform X2 [Contarinia nasturtii]|uniref:intraflagellar transport protein 43 homolog isoform X2 n=1 Tax=Contarinia nasturtii TaxID=265458 RepID=UPI0012D3C3C9|nr:intraflagellar transport protein 43 homolog isoform X2 [Contarinia nasturtii]